MEVITIVMNESSGSAATKAPAVEEAVARAGLRATCVRVRGPEILAAAERAAAAHNVLVAAGGDGTLSTVASVAAKTGSTFGVIPLGTLNHFARDVGIPLKLDEAVRTIAAGRTRALDIGTLNDATFINNASLGIYPRLVWERQQEQCRGRAKWTAFAIGMVRTWRRYPTVAVRMTVDDVKLVRQTPFVFIGNGKYRAEGFGIGTRDGLQNGTLSLYLAPGVGRFEFLELPVRAIAGRLNADVKFEMFTGREIIVETARRAVDVAMDGELRSVVPPFHCAVRAGALRTIVPEAE